MTNQQHPIIPPQELVQQWVDEIYGQTECDDARDEHIAIQAAHWGADQELEASVNWLIENQNPRWAVELRTARHPKPPSLAEQALKARDRMWNFCSEPADWELVRVALVRLQELEKGNE